MKKYIAIGIFLFLISSSIFFTLSTKGNAQEVVEDERSNILLIMIDDMNDWVGALGGHPQANTPNIDKLAKDGTLFKNAHAGVPICNGSRTNIMTGMLPTRTGVLGNGDDFFEHVPDAVTMVDSFNDAGYYTAGYGKIFHAGSTHAYRWDDFGSDRNPSPPEEEKPLNGMIEPGGNFDWGALDIDPSEMGDYKRAQSGIDFINNWEEENGPFFLAVGFSKPHLPWYCPAESYEKIAEGVTEDIILPEVIDNDLDDLSELEYGWRNPNKLHTPVVEANQWQSAVHSYLACGSHVDDQVGRIMNALDNSEFAENTIVVLVSDHGFQLGEKSAWKKGKLWEESTRVPFIIRMPNHKENGYTSATNKSVNIGAIYPTLLEMTNIEEPYLEGHENYKIDYNSLSPLIYDSKAKWAGAAVSFYGEGNVSIRTFNKRYTFYDNGATEMYNLKQDPNEWTNLAPDSSNLSNEMLNRQRRANRFLTGNLNNRI